MSIIAVCKCKHEIFEGDNFCSACGNADHQTWEYFSKSNSESDKMKYAKASYYLGKTISLYEKAGAKEEVNYLRSFVKRYIYG